MKKEQKEWLKNLEKLVREKLEGEGSGHDWWHIHRVRNNALMILEKEEAESFIVEAAALLHDIADHKFHNGDLEVGPRTASGLLIEMGVENTVADRIATIIKEVSFKGAGVATPVSSQEAAIVQDADRLDAIGAIGIARAFAYGGHKNRLLYDPEKAPQHHDSFEAYYHDDGATINHFYEKLLLLKDRMNTVTAKSIAQKRHEYMKGYLDQFYREWEGKDLKA